MDWTQLTELPRHEVVHGHDWNAPCAAYRETVNLLAHDQGVHERSAYPKQLGGLLHREQEFRQSAGYAGNLGACLVVAHGDWLASVRGRSARRVSHLVYSTAVSCAATAERSVGSAGAADGVRAGGNTRRDEVCELSLIQLRMRK